MLVSNRHGRPIKLRERETAEVLVVAAALVAKDADGDFFAEFQ